MTASSTAAISAGTVTTWTLDASHTLVEFSAKHLMFTTVKGRFTGVEGVVRADEQNPGNSSVQVTIDATSLSSGDARRDGHLKSADFLDVDNHPTITFTSTRVEPRDGDASRMHVIGDLTIRGVTREIVLDTTLEGRGPTPFGTTVAAFSATATINRKDFGLNWNVALESGGGGGGGGGEVGGGGGAGGQGGGGY
jgi:polyisoprenoid-binding protein YceI